MANSWTEVKGCTVGRMEFHLEKMDEAIQMLEQSGLDVVAKKLRDAHKMMVKDLNERWSPKQEEGGIALVIVERKSAGGVVDPDYMKPEDILKELQKQAKKNSNVGRI